MIFKKASPNGIRIEHVWMQITTNMHIIYLFIIFHKQIYQKSNHHQSLKYSFWKKNFRFSLWATYFIRQHLLLSHLIHAHITIVTLELTFERFSGRFPKEKKSAPEMQCQYNINEMKLMASWIRMFKNRNIHVFLEQFYITDVDIQYLRWLRCSMKWTHYY